MKAWQWPILRILIVRPRLLLAAAAAVLLFVVLPVEWRLATRLVAVWDAGIAFYLALAALMMMGADNNHIRQRATKQDEGGLVILFLMIVGVVASVAAIMLKLATAKGLAGAAEVRAIGLAGATVFLSWVFMQTIFALHYAHYYYNQQKDGGGGLEFPGKFTAPDYWDFVYFSFIIGTAAQTADINIISPTLRKIVTLQCVIVFFFNTTILALAINIGAGLAAG